MARALQASSSRTSTTSRANPSSRTSGSRTKRTTAPRYAPPKAPTRTITTRTAKDRVQPSPIARVVHRRDAPTQLRKYVLMAMGFAFVAISLMMVVVVFQTRLAETQMGVDEIETQITSERNRYDQLRLERSLLREPARLVSEAEALGMVPGSRTDFQTVDPEAVAAVLVSSGNNDSISSMSSRDPLKRYGAVKSLIGGN